MISSVYDKDTTVFISVLYRTIELYQYVTCRRADTA